MAGLGAAPFAGMLLADMGADVIAVDRPDRGYYADREPTLNFLNRGKRSVVIDIKRPAAAALLLRAVEEVDVLIEGCRPGVMEAAGLGPAECLARRPSLVYARITGWGQDGPYARKAGHDINFLAASGVLHAMGDPEGEPPPPLNLVGDMGGGGAVGAFGIVAALFHAGRTGRGQVLDCAMSEGVALLATHVRSLWAMGHWSDTRGANLFDGGAPAYHAYRTKDDRFVALGAVEPKLYDALLRRLDELDGCRRSWPDRADRANWPALRRQLAAVFAARTRAQWVAAFAEAAQDAHFTHRGTFAEVNGVPQPTRLPRLSATPPDVPNRPPSPGEHTHDVLTGWGLRTDEIAGLHADRTVA
jgi:alpha-methylacyl-CoA racemase